jgi:hypothetical protein
MDFCWTSVIWTLALQHKNLQVGQLSTATASMSCSSTTCPLLSDVKYLVSAQLLQPAFVQQLAFFTLGSITRASACCFVFC